MSRDVRYETVGFLKLSTEDSLICHSVFSYHMINFRKYEMLKNILVILSLAATGDYFTDCLPFK